MFVFVRFVRVFFVLALYTQNIFLPVRCACRSLRTHAPRNLKVQDETSNIADNVMGRLFGQRETLESAQQRVRTGTPIVLRVAINALRVQQGGSSVAGALGLGVHDATIAVLQSPISASSEPLARGNMLQFRYGVAPIEGFRLRATPVVVGRSLCIPEGVAAEPQILVVLRQSIPSDTAVALVPLSVLAI